MKPKQYHDIQKRIDMDLISRGGFAIAAYIIIFPTIFYPYGFYAKEPLISGGITLSAIFVGVLRLCHLRLTPYFYDRFPPAWMNIFKLLSLTHAVILSLLFCLVNTDARFHDMYQITMLVCAGVASAAISSLSPNLLMSLTYPQIVLLPSIVLNFFSGEDQFVGFATIFYLTYLTALAMRTNKEYLRTFEVEAKLERQKKALQTLSQTDALTALYNRGYFNTIYETLWQSCMRNNIGMTLMIMDLDDFKKVNDTYGHISGDSCLKVVAQILNGYFHRKTDISCRFGGEEFAVLISNTSLHEAEKLAEQIRQHIENTWIENGDHRFRVTASFGLATTLPKIGEKSIALMEQADQALYLAKKQGRNCVRSTAQLE